MIVGAQMFTIRNYLDTLPEVSDALSRIADMGYTAVQLSALCPYEAEWMDEQLRKNGLIAPITHYNFDRIMDDTDKVIAEHKAMGCEYIGIGYVPDEAKLKAKGHIAAKKIADAGMKLMLHNHDRDYLEMQEGKVRMMYYSDEFTLDEVGFTLDLYWAEAAGKSAEAELRRLNGRVPVVHYKDLLNVDGEQRFAPVGYGQMDYERLTEVAVECGTKYAFVEQDKCYGENPFDCLKKELRLLKINRIKIKKKQAERLAFLV